MTEIFNRGDPSVFSEGSLVFLAKSRILGYNRSK